MGHGARGWRGQGGGSAGCEHTCSRTCTCTQVDGKLICPKCAVRLGSYTWSGMQCSCGAWVAPAIQVVKSKVDEVLIKIG